jgi:hypothetical protein
MPALPGAEKCLAHLEGDIRLHHSPFCATIIVVNAGVAQLVAHLLPKQTVAGSSPVSRSNPYYTATGPVPAVRCPIS